MVTISVRNMVCPRCIMAVQQILNRLHIKAESVKLGKIELSEPLTQKASLELKQELENIGFGWIENKQQKIAEQIKNAIIHLIRNEEKLGKVNLSSYLSDICHSDYSSISKLFSECEGITIERYFIMQKIERVKELLSYDELSISEIADRLNYSSIAHLSTQFKSITGVTPTQFKQRGNIVRNSIDKIK